MPPSTHAPTHHPSTCPPSTHLYLLIHILTHPLTTYPLSLHSYVHPLTYLHAHPTTHAPTHPPSIYQLICVPVRPLTCHASVRLPTCIRTHSPTTHPHAYPSPTTPPLSIHSSAHPPTHSHAHLPTIYPSICPPSCLHAHPPPPIHCPSIHPSIIHASIHPVIPRNQLMSGLVLGAWDPKMDVILPRPQGALG